MAVVWGQGGADNLVGNGFARRFQRLPKLAIFVVDSLHRSAHNWRKASYKTREL